MTVTPVLGFDLRNAQSIGVLVGVNGCASALRITSCGQPSARAA